MPITTRNQFLGVPYGTFRVRENNDAQVNYTSTLKRHSIDNGNSQFLIDIDFAGYRQSGMFRKFTGHQLEHGHTSFSMPMPQDDDIEVAQGAPILISGADAGVSQLTLKSTENFFIPYGLYVNAKNHNKVYQILGVVGGPDGGDVVGTGSVDTNDPGINVKIKPILQVTIPDGTQLEIENTMVRVFYGFNQPGVQVSGWTKTTKILFIEDVN